MVDWTPNSIVRGWIMTEWQIALWLTPEGEQELLRRQCLSYVVDGGWV